MRISTLAIGILLLTLNLKIRTSSIDDYDAVDYDDYSDYIYDDDYPDENQAVLNDNIKTSKNDKCENMDVEDCPFKIYQKLSLQEKALLNTKDGCKIRQQITNLNLESKSTDFLIKTANDKYCFLIYIEAQSLEKILSRNDVARGLNDETIRFMIQSPLIAKTLEKLPNITIAKLTNANPKIAALLPTDKEFPAKKLMKKLMLNKDYIRTLRVEILAYLAETPFRTLLSEDVIHLILKIHPTLTSHLSDEGKKIIPKFIHKNQFLERIACMVIQNIVSDEKFISRLSSKDIRKLIRTERIWDCLPIEQIRKALRTTHLVNRASISDLYDATKSVPLDKRLHPLVIWNMIWYQMPSYAKYGLVNIFH